MGEVRYTRQSISNEFVGFSTYAYSPTLSFFPPPTTTITYSWTRWGFQGLSLNQLQGTAEGDNFLSELGFAPYKDWWSLVVLGGMIVGLRIGEVACTKWLSFEKR